MGSEVEKKLKKKIEKLEKKATWPNRIYKLVTIIGVPTLFVLIGILYNQL